MKSSLVTEFITRTYRQPYRPLDVRSAEKKGGLVMDDTTDPYNDFIWALARKFTSSADEAAAAVHEMKTDIRRCGEWDTEPSPEDRIVAKIAWRRLLKFLQ